jgi:hypothetical protein
MPKWCFMMLPISTKRTSIAEAMVEVSVSSIVAYGMIFGLVLYFIFRSNVNCLLFGLDGTSWLLEFKRQAARQPFSQFGVDPLEGNFDAYYPAFREYFLPEALSLLVNWSDAGKAVTYTAYGILMVFATYCLSRATGFSRSVGFFGGALFAALALPTTLTELSWFYAIYNLIPHLAQVSCIAIMITACFWAIEFERPALALILTLTAVGLAVLSIASFVTPTVLILPLVAVYGGASIFAAGKRVDALCKIAAAAACIGVPAALGMVQYVMSAGRYTAYNFFDQEFMQSRASSYFASILYQSGALGKAIVILGLSGALYAAFVGSRKLRVFALTHIGATALFQVVALLVVTYTEGYHGPSPLYFEIMMWPIMFLFAAFAVSAAWRRIGGWLMSALGAMRQQRDLVVRHGLLFGVTLFLAGWNGLATASGRPTGCASIDFFPIRANPITDYLRTNMATAVGAPFRGLAATFNGTRGTDSHDWFSFHGTDGQIWRGIGNDLRLVGLWWYEIPTLIQYSPLITPPYYLLLTEFLATPADRQIRSILVLTHPNEPMLRLWGVRFVIVDYAVGFGKTLVEIAVPGHTNVRLVELPDANLGDFSPTEVRNIGSFREGLAAMHAPDFDGRRAVVTEQPLRGPIVAAVDAHLVYEKDGFSVRASSAGRSILVLPVQYSRCWSVSGGEGNPVLFRANLMQLGISFTGKLDANLVFRFGPFFASACRVEDVRDMERLKIREARTR